MTTPVSVAFSETDLDAIAGAQGRVAVCVTPDGKLDQAARRVNRLTKGTLARIIDSGALEKKKPGDIVTLAWPVGLAAEAIVVMKLARRAPEAQARRAGAALVWRLAGQRATSR